MEIKEVPIDKVDVWDKNPRNIKKADFNRLKLMITKLGVYKPLICVLENGRYITLGGNMRLRAIRELGHPIVGISIVEAKTNAEKMEYALSDNDRAGVYDDQTLAEMIYNQKDNIDTELFKIDMAKPIGIENLLTQFGPKVDISEEDTIPGPETTVIAKLGDLYKLGPHRLLCGDATKPESYTALLEGKPVDLVFTDPPQITTPVIGKIDKFGATLGDDLSEEQFEDLAFEFIGRMKENLKPGGTFYICSVFPSYPIFAYALKANDLIFAGPIIWIKNQATPAWADYGNKYEMILKGKKSKRKKAEPILYGWAKGKHYFREHTKEADVWEIASRSSKSMLHPLQKPLGLIQRAIRNSSKPDEAILDPFAGVGSTMIAADREARTAYAMELDPKYIDIIIRRFAALGGLTESEIRATKKEFIISDIKLKPPMEGKK